QMQAWAAPVVGRRTPTGEIVRPARALNRLDLPLPVGPASATTVSSGARESRCRAWSATVRVARSRSGGRYGETARRNRPSASMRTPSEPASSQVVAVPGGASGAEKANDGAGRAGPPAGGPAGGGGGGVGGAEMGTPASAVPGGGSRV